jgi:hypothetical protein
MHALRHGVPSITSRPPYPQTRNHRQRRTRAAIHRYPTSKQVLDPLELTSRITQSAARSALAMAIGNESTVGYWRVGRIPTQHTTQPNCPPAPLPDLTLRITFLSITDANSLETVAISITSMGPLHHAVRRHCRAASRCDNWVKGWAG